MMGMYADGVSRIVDDHRAEREATAEGYRQRRRLRGRPLRLDRQTRRRRRGWFGWLRLSPASRPVPDH